MAKKKKKKDEEKEKVKKPLTVKQQRFVEEYCKDFNATQAAIRAGYSEKTVNKNVARMMVNEGIKKAIDERIKKRKKRIEITEDRIIDELSKIAFSDLKDFYDKDFVLKDISLLPNELTSAIKEIVKFETKNGTRVGVKFYSKETALELLGKHLGMWKADQTDKDWHVIIEYRTKRKK